MDLRSPGKISRLDELPRLRGKIQLEGERKNDIGRPNFGEQKGVLYFPIVVLYLKLCIEDNGGRDRVMQGQQFLILIKARLSNLSYAKV